MPPISSQVPVTMQAKTLETTIPRKCNAYLQIDLSTSIDGDNLQVGFLNNLNELVYTSLRDSSLDLNDPADLSYIATELDHIFTTNGSFLTYLNGTDISIYIPRCNYDLQRPFCLRTASDPAQLTSGFTILK